MHGETVKKTIMSVCILALNILHVNYIFSAPYYIFFF